MPPRGGGGGGGRRGGGGGGWRGGGGHHHHHHGGGWGPGWGGGGWYGAYPGSELVVVETPVGGPLYDTCPCACRCHDNAKLTYHTVPVRTGQACCRCPFMPRAQAVKAQLSGFDMGSIPWKPVLAAAAGVGLLWWLTRGRKRRNR